MPKISYEEKSFRGSSLEIIENANKIIEEYEEQGFSLTLRQLYYQFVSRDLIANKQSEYKRLGGIINDARLAGLIDWNAIEDRTRNIKGRASWDSPQEIVEACARQYHMDRWANQVWRPYVFIEKDALIGVIEGVCYELDVPFFSCRGYTSQSEMWRFGQRSQQHFGEDQVPVIIHLGDHDPSGIDMSRDLQDRMNIFCPGVGVKRIALTRAQIEEYSPPPNPAKVADSRFWRYMATYGGESWELDALEPSVMSSLIRETIDEYRDMHLWESVEKEEEEGRKKLMEFVDQSSKGE